MPCASAYDRSRRDIALDDAKHLVVWQTSHHVTWTPWSAAWSAHIDDLVKGSITADTFIDLFTAEVNLEPKAGREEIGK
jgi:hypothetical protein